MAVRRTDWKTLPMPSAVAVLRLALGVDAADLARISLGHLPEDMDDKWFIYREGDRLFFHRSWTGTCVYSAAIEARGDGATIGEVIVNRDPEQYRSDDDAQDLLILRFLIEAILLGRDVPFPMPADSALAAVPAGLYQHAVAGTGAQEVVMDSLNRGVSFARRVFTVAGVYGVIVLAPQYFMEERVGRDFPPPITHPEHFYGFIGVALAW